MGWTWLCSGISAHEVLFNEAASGLLLSQNQDYAFAFLAKAKFIIRNLPSFLRRSEKHVDNQGLMDFNTSDSKLTALPSTEPAGRSTDASFVFRDELAKHPYGETNLASIGPTIDTGQAKLIDLSTIDKTDLENHFTDRVQKSLKNAVRTDLPSGLTLFTGGESGAALVFGGWRLRPVRSEGETLDTWFARISRKYTLVQLEQEYPETIEEALKFSEARAYFDIQALEEMGVDSREPIKQSEISTFNNAVRVFKLPVVGRKYCIFTDPSNGVDDPFATVVYDVQSGEGIITASAKIKVERCAEIHDYLVRKCNNAFNCFDITGQVGGEFARILKELETPNQSPRYETIQSGGKIKKDRVGLYLSVQHKKEMLSALEKAIRLRVVRNYDKEATHQFQAFILPEGEDMPRITKGMHEDFVIAWGGVVKTSEYMPKGGVRVTSGKYRD